MLQGSVFNVHATFIVILATPDNVDMWTMDDKRVKKKNKENHHFIEAILLAFWLRQFWWKSEVKESFLMTEITKAVVSDY